MTDVKKPCKRIARNVMGHGFNLDVVVTIHPNGVIGLRELHRRKEFLFSISALVKAAMTEEAKVKRAAKRKRR